MRVEMPKLLSTAAQMRIRDRSRARTNLASIGIMMRSLLATLALATIGALALPGCVIEGQSCTMMAGDHGLHLSLRGAVAGEYTVVVRSDLVEAQCPFVIGPQRDGSYQQCNVRRGEAYVGMSGWNNEPQITLSGSYGSGYMAELPSSVDVSVFAADGTKLLEETRYPSYRNDYPNGVDCDVEPYRSATEVFDLPAHSNRECSEMGLEHSLRMTFAGGTGRYKVRLDSAPVLAECDLDTVQPPSSRACNAQRGSAYVSIDSATGLPAVEIQGDPTLLPDEIRVRVTDASDQLVLDETRTPNYAERYPNGRECDPYPSRTARESFVIPPSAPLDAGAGD